VADYTFELTIPDQYIAEMIDVFGYTWPATVVDENGDTIPNPVTKAQFAQTELKAFVVACIRNKVIAHRKLLADLAVSGEFDVL
jgi:hypothetical protein